VSPWCQTRTLLTQAPVEPCQLNQRNWTIIF
jgi:hypothetical protein